MVELKFQPAIVPDSAFTAPALVTLNGALAGVACPAQNLYVKSAADTTATSFPVPSVNTPVLAKTALPPVKLPAAKVHPPTVPWLAVMPDAPKVVLPATT